MRVNGTNVALVIAVCAGLAGAFGPKPQSAATAASLKAKTYYDNQTPLSGTGLCEHYCGVWYGLAHAGWASATGVWGVTVSAGTAAANWNAMPASHKLDDYAEGALAFWTGGGGGYGHCAIGAPKTGSIFSTDYPKAGFVGHTHVTTIDSHWGNLKWAGWARAYFPNAVALNGTNVSIV